MLYNGGMNSEHQPTTPKEWFDNMREQLSKAEIGGSNPDESNPYVTGNGLDRLRLLALRRIRQETGI
jgi:hypothetical protein